jgi:hypothetical protein
MMIMMTLMIEFDKRLRPVLEVMPNRQQPVRRVTKVCAILMIDRIVQVEQAGGKGEWERTKARPFLRVGIVVVAHTTPLEIDLHGGNFLQDLPPHFVLVHVRSVHGVPLPQSPGRLLVLLLLLLFRAFVVLDDNVVVVLVLADKTWTR